jgi:hypothetical protein
VRLRQRTAIYSCRNDCASLSVGSEWIMNVLQAEIIKLIRQDTFTTSEITDKLNHSGWGVKPDDFSTPYIA